MRGRVASTVATESRRFSPPESVNGFASARRSSRSAVEQLVDAGATLGSATSLSARGPTSSSARTDAGEELVLRLLEHGADAGEQVA